MSIDHHNSNASASCRPTLSQWVSKCFVVAHRENTDRLVESLRCEGFFVEVVRIDYTADQIGMSSTRKCLLTHREVWLRAVTSAQPWMSVEADFVPCVGLGAIPVPLWVTPEKKRLLYLYACGPTLYRVVDAGWAEGDAGGCVALAAEPEVAQFLRDMTEADLCDAPPRTYSLWDSKVSATLRRTLDVRTLIPIHNLGEHGGKPNPEHRDMGLNPAHRADRLASPLHFLPMYADGNRRRYRWVRFHYWLHGCGRLVFGRLVGRGAVWKLRNRLLFFCIKRLVALHRHPRTALPPEVP